MRRRRRKRERRKKEEERDKEGRGQKEEEEEEMLKSIERMKREGKNNLKGRKITKKKRQRKR